MSWKFSDLSEAPHMMNIAARWARRKIFSLLAPPLPRYTVRGGASHEPTLHPAIYRVSPHDSPPKVSITFCTEPPWGAPCFEGRREGIYDSSQSREGWDGGRSNIPLCRGRQGVGKKEIFIIEVCGLSHLPPQTTQHIFKRERRSKKKLWRNVFSHTLPSYPKHPFISRFGAIDISKEYTVYHSKTLYFQYRTTQNVFRSGIP